MAWPARGSSSAIAGAMREDTRAGSAVSSASTTAPGRCGSTTTTSSPGGTVRGGSHRGSRTERQPARHHRAGLADSGKGRSSSPRRPGGLGAARGCRRPCRWAAVTPVLVGHAQLPMAEDLPEPLKTLPGRQAIEVRPEHFDDDVEELIRRMGGWRRRWRGFPLWAWALAVTALAGILLVAFVVRRNMAPLIDPQQIEAVAGVARGNRYPLLGDRRPRRGAHAGRRPGLGQRKARWRTSATGG